ncbi:GPW/gp25 family protein [Nostoc sp. UHCC 0870]|uniref:GPW/gp25 family protein n=1 Tax=Nostoc sp. UHCC 0870 TaxID=2914041 RepID=UPI001EDDBB67|nr:GPW/gp25 family protein [Nostoc sp. UHCC 0870]UKO99356.1 GPW/gp25 family protein [Nostoc sp. UHCC 0870]
MNGLNFPLQIVNGNLSVVTDGNLYKAHILSFLQTELRERVMRPQYGLKDYLFETISDITLIAANIKTGLQQYVPEIQLEVTGNINDQGEAEISIYWLFEDEEQPTIRLTL